MSKTKFSTIAECRNNEKWLTTADAKHGGFCQFL